MSKFKSGDKVKRISHDYNQCKEGNIYTVSSCSDVSLNLLEINGSYDPKFFKLAEPEFKNGDEVEVSEGGNHWNKAKYLTYNKRGIRPHVVVAEGFSESTNWTFCRDRKKEYTLKECADALGVPVYEFRIKDE